VEEMYDKFSGIFLLVFRFLSFFFCLFFVFFFGGLSRLSIVLIVCFCFSVDTSNFILLDCFLQSKAIALCERAKGLGVWQDVGRHW